jgi:RNA polymerase sigma factor (sigma-70 family)
MLRSRSVGRVGDRELQLLDLCRTGDDEAWRQLVDLYAGYVYAIVGRGYRLPVQDCEDVFQEVFARLFEHLHDLRDDAALRGWIGQTARRLAIDRLRALKRESPAGEGGLPEVPEEDVDLERLGSALDLRAQVESLPAHCREVIIRFFIRDESYRVIGEAMEIPAGTIASRISRCLQTLREQLAPEP